ncbi:hypothetical protein M0812_13695 [Anaeramoeba flamelloides]|uniref:Uncharacterized protein n=1 Tax=Anaeramoeba flamelloides TaxID=1746091 RepID=A0AAV7ZLY1_9EUKA|nr:hypothetical protein M0812_13695 [Anaeramoeba flamelloides]
MSKSLFQTIKKLLDEEQPFLKHINEIIKLKSDSLKPFYSETLFTTKLIHEALQKGPEYFDSIFNWMFTWYHRNDPKKHLFVISHLPLFLYHFNILYANTQSLNKSGRAKLLSIQSFLLSVYSSILESVSDQPIQFRSVPINTASIFHSGFEPLNKQMPLTEMNVQTHNQRKNSLQPNIETVFESLPVISRINTSNIQILNLVILSKFTDHISKIDPIPIICFCGLMARLSIIGFNSLKKAHKIVDFYCSDIDLPFLHKSLDKAPDLQQTQKQNKNDKKKENEKEKEKEKINKKQKLQNLSVRISISDYVWYEIIKGLLFACGLEKLVELAAMKTLDVIYERALWEIRSDILLLIKSVKRLVLSTKKKKKKKTTKKKN